MTHYQVSVLTECLAEIIARFDIAIEDISKSLPLPTFKPKDLPGIRPLHQISINTKRPTGLYFTFNSINTNTYQISLKSNMTKSKKISAIDADKATSEFKCTLNSVQNTACFRLTQKSNRVFDFKSLLSDLADMIDSRHEKFITHLIKTNDIDDLESIPFSNLIGLGTSGYRIFDVWNMSGKSSCILAFSDFPFIFRNSNEESINFIGNSKIKTLLSSFERPIFDSLRESPRNKRPLNLDDVIVEFSPVHYFSEDPTEDPTQENDDNFYFKDNRFYVPRTMLGGRKGFNIEGRPDPIDEFEYALVAGSRPLIEALKEFKGKVIESEHASNFFAEIVDGRFNTIDKDNELLESIWSLIGIRLTDETRIYEVDVSTELYQDFNGKKLPKDRVFYVKNHIKTTGRRREPKRLLPRRSFGSTNIFTVKTFLKSAQTPDQILMRKKRKNFKNDNNAILMKRRLEKRKSANLGRKIYNSVDLFKKYLDDTDKKHKTSADTFSRTLMKSEEAKKFLSKYIRYSNHLSEDITIRTDQEWCHLVAYMDGGNNKPDNLVAGSYQSNTEEFAIESAIRECADYRYISVKYTAYLIPGSVFVNNITDDIFQHILDATIFGIEEFRPSIAELHEIIFNFKATHEFIRKKVQLSIDTYYLYLLEKIKILGYKGINAEDIQQFTSRIALEEEPNIVSRGYIGGMEEIYDETIQSQFDLIKKRKNIHNALRGVFDTLASQYYQVLPVAAFVRYVIYHDSHKVIDYVVDAQREEFDINQFQLTKISILSKIEHPEARDRRLSAKTTRGTQSIYNTREYHLVENKHSESADEMMDDRSRKQVKMDDN